LQRPWASLVTHTGGDRLGDVVVEVAVVGVGVRVAGDRVCVLCGCRVCVLCGCGLCVLCGCGLCVADRAAGEDVKLGCGEQPAVAIAAATTAETRMVQGRVNLVIGRCFL